MSRSVCPLLLFSCFFLSLLPLVDGASRSRPSPPPPSWRRKRLEEEAAKCASFDSALEATPEFRGFVAKKLAESLDRWQL